MRTLTAPQISVLQSKNRAHHERVLIAAADGSMQDLTNIGGYSYLQEIEWREDVRTPVSEATIVLARQNVPGSIAPNDEDSALNQVGGSYSPAVDIGRFVQIQTATVVIGATPTEWETVFEGYTLPFRVSEKSITLDVLGRGARLASRQIREKREYGTEAGELLDDTLQAILDDWFDGEELIVPNPPNSAVKSYQQQEGSVLAAARTLARLGGGRDVRYWWDEVSGEFKPTLLDIDRDPSATVWSFDAGLYYGIRKFEVDPEGTRNQLEVHFTDRSTGKRDVYSVEDPAAVQRYGPEFQRLVEPSESPIDSPAEAKTFGDIALADLKDPFANLEVELPYFWPIQLWDFVEFKADKTRFSEDQQLGVVAIRNRIAFQGEDRVERTWLTCRGKPAGNYNEWIAHNTSRPTEDRRARFRNFRYQRIAGAVRVLWDANPYLSDVYVYRRQAASPAPQSQNDDNWPEVEGPPDAQPTEGEYTVEEPPDERVELLRFVALASDGTIGQVKDVAVESFSNSIGPGTVTEIELIQSAQNFGSTITWDSPDWDRVTWSAGEVITADGTLYQVPSGGTGAMALPVVRYVYLDTTSAPYTLQVSTDSRDAIGPRLIHLAMVGPAASPGQRAWFVPKVGALGLNGEHIRPSAVSANHMETNTLTAIDVNAFGFQGVTVTAGLFQNAAGLRFFDLEANGSELFIKHDAFELTADGKIKARNLRAIDRITLGTESGDVFTGLGSIRPTPNGLALAGAGLGRFGLTVEDGFGAGPLLAFFEGTPTTRPVISAATADAIIQALASLNLVDDQTP